jgi:hypothetical protein
MLGYLDARLAERSRPNYTTDLAEYAQLEYPNDDPRAVSLRAHAEAEAVRKAAHPRFRFFRAVRPAAEVAPLKT